MNWLESLKNDMLEITQAEALKYWPPFQNYTLPSFNERLEHVKHVEKNAIKLHKIYGGDIDIILASVWIHDRAKFEMGDHAKNASDWALINLCKTDFPEHKIKEVVYAVKVHSGWVTKDINTVEAKILWDADKLSHFGPAYFMDSIFSFTSKKVCEREKQPDIISFHETISMDNFILKFKEFKNSLDNDKISNMFYFDESKRLVRKYINANIAFYEVLEEQFN